MKQVVGVAFLGLFCLTLGVGPIRAARKNCARLCQNEIGTCRAAVPPNSSCPHGRGHRACVNRLQKARSQCRSRILRQCKQNADANTCLPPTTTTVPTGGSTTTTLPGTACDLSQTRCTGTLTGSANETFDCSNLYANFKYADVNDTIGKTRFGLRVVPLPSDVSALNIDLGFVGSPQAPGTYAFPTNAGSGEFDDALGKSGVMLLLLNGHSFTAGPPPAGPGTMVLTLSSANLRPPPTTLGDWCLHGTLDVTLPESSASGGSVTLHATF
jgi:hypothetical protein